MVNLIGESSAVIPCICRNKFGPSSSGTSASEELPSWDIFRFNMRSYRCGIPRHLSRCTPHVAVRDPRIDVCRSVILSCSTSILRRARNQTCMSLSRCGVNLNVRRPNSIMNAHRFFRLLFSPSTMPNLLSVSKDMLHVF